MFILHEWIDAEHVIFCSIWIKWHHADIKIAPMFSATSTVSNCWLPTVSLLPISWSKHVVCISVWNWVTRTRFELHTWPASHAPSICDNGPRAQRTAWNLEYPWCGGAVKSCNRLPLLCYWFDCYFCAIDLTRMNKNNRSSLKYPDLDSASRPVAHCEDILIPVYAGLCATSEDDYSSIETEV